MGKKQQRSATGGARPQDYVAPEFQKHVKEKYGEEASVGLFSDEMRLSDRIDRLIKPYMDDDVRNSVLLLDCAIIAWNESIREDFGVKGSYSLNNALLNYAHYRQNIDAIKARKRLLFPDDDRFIIEGKIYSEGDHMHLNIASSIDMERTMKAALARLTDLLSGMKE